MQRDRRTQFKVERMGPNIPPRPGVNRPLRSKKPSGIAANALPTGSSTQIHSSYNSAQKQREISGTRFREGSTTRNSSNGPVVERGVRGNSRENLSDETSKNVRAT